MDPKEDEEISIDFSKIKNFFKSDKKQEEKSIDEGIKETPPEPRKDDEMSIDFTKIKKFFKTGSGETKKEDDIQIDWGSAINFFKKYGVVFLALIPIILCIYIRMQTSSLSFTDSWAANSVIGNIKSQIKSGIDQQYPNLPDANKNALVDAEIQKVLSSKQAQIDQQIQATSNYIKSFFQDESGKMYMPDIDPYYWFRYAKNIVEHGQPGDVLKDGNPFDKLQLAPLGRNVQSDTFYPYFLAYFYKLLHFFAPDLTLMRSMFYYPIFVSALCVLIVFLIARRISGDIGGFFASLMMAVNAAFLGRTLSPDNDAWNIFFSLILTWLFLETLEEKNIVKVIVLTSLAGFFTGLFAFEWSGWWFIFDFLLATIFVTFAYLAITNLSELKKNARLFFAKTAIRNILLFVSLYILSSFVFVGMFIDFRFFMNSALGPLGFSSIKTPVQGSSLWPNVLTTVAELNEGSVGAIMNSVGGKLLFFISLIGLVLSVHREGGFRRFDFYYVAGSISWYALLFFAINNFGISLFGIVTWIVLPIALWVTISILKRNSSYDFKLSILLSLWVVATIFASIKGIRFTLLLAPAFSVALGTALGMSYFYISEWSSRELKINKTIVKAVMIILILSVFYTTPVKSAYNSAGSNTPLINDAWYGALNSIKQDSKPNAIITSWWDFGHHFKALADRPVTFDGTTQTDTASHWVGKLFMTDNEVQAIGILRMLDCAHNSAYNTLYNVNKDSHKSKKIVDEIILLEKEDAFKRLKSYGLSEKQANEIVSYTNCNNPPEAYVIASEDMIGKSGVWAHFGSWNFERADIWENARRKPEGEASGYMMSKFNYTKEKAEGIYSEIQDILNEPDSNQRDSKANAWIAPWPGYGGTASCSKNSEGIYACSNGMQVNLTNLDIFGVNQQGIVRPKKVAFTIDSGILKKEYNGSTLDFGVTVIPRNENEIQLVLSSKELTGSIFTRMFFMQGHGLRYFKLFNHQRGLTGTSIYVYKVDWEGKNATIVADFVKKPASAKEEINLTK